jgi:hypothetical protein
VARAGLKAGACVLNLTGSHNDEEMFAIAAQHQATVVLCHVLGPHARSLDDADVDPDPVPRMLERFGLRIERARELGATDLVIDPVSASASDPPTSSAAPATRPRRYCTRSDCVGSAFPCVTLYHTHSTSSRTNFAAAKASSRSWRIWVGQVSTALTKYP